MQINFQNILSFARAIFIFDITKLICVIIKLFFLTNALLCVIIKMSRQLKTIIRVKYHIVFWMTLVKTLYGQR